MERESPASGYTPRLRELERVSIGEKSQLTILNAYKVDQSFHQVLLSATTSFGRPLTRFCSAIPS